MHLPWLMPMGWLELAGTIGAALVGSLVLAVAAAGALAIMPRAWLATSHGLLLVLLIPAAWFAMWPPPHLPAWPTASTWPPLRLTIGAMPLLLLPPLRALARMPPNQRRAAAGLGAGPAAMLRLVWLPQLAPSMLLGVLLAALLDLAALILLP